MLFSEAWPPRATARGGVEKTVSSRAAHDIVHHRVGAFPKSFSVKAAARWVNRTGLVELS